MKTHISEEKLNQKILLNPKEQQNPFPNQIAVHPEKENPKLKVEEKKGYWRVVDAEGKVHKLDVRSYLTMSREEDGKTRWLNYKPMDLVRRKKIFY